MLKIFTINWQWQTPVTVQNPVFSFVHVLSLTSQANSRSCTAWCAAPQYTNSALSHMLTKVIKRQLIWFEMINHIVICLFICYNLFTEEEKAVKVII